VPENASEEQIKKRFRELAKIYHPDRGGDPEKFKQILKAYQILSDKKLRSEYDLERRINQTSFSYNFEDYDFENKTEEDLKNENYISTKAIFDDEDNIPEVIKIKKFLNIIWTLWAIGGITFIGPLLLGILVNKIFFGETTNEKLFGIITLIYYVPSPLLFIIIEKLIVYYFAKEITIKEKVKADIFTFLTILAFFGLFCFWGIYRILVNR
jgi:hypothetical protein